MKVDLYMYELYIEKKNISNHPHPFAYISFIHLYLYIHISIVHACM